MTDIFLYSGNYYYTRSQAISWVLSGSGTSYSLLDKHFKLLEKMIKSKAAPIIINCQANTNLEENALIVFLENMTSDLHALAFVNINSEEASRAKNIIEKTQSLNEKLTCELTCPTGQNHQIVVTGRNKSNSFSTIANLNQSTLELENQKIKEYLTDCYKPFSEKKMLLSTAITANGEFDAFKIISDPSKFLWVTLKLADQVKNLVESSRFSDYRILAVSLRGTILAGAVAGLCGLSVNTIDHLGPKYKVIDLEFTETLKNKKYIYIGDFVIGGTEIKIAQAYTRMFGGELNYAFSIGSMLDASNYESSFILKSLYKLNELASIDYTIDYK